ncbi:DUF1345 domain-containing protein [Hymenobacter coccineus]|uniref:DUF1345 domain-containing protein n=1 Tax=Hymenobacter coccineus TaxID=1908235 RepID=A0A1G1TM42_9BACT|nr:DUF1345 domain-containing protein [Hymenobacter coccineus]OGX91949.1 hypothetical protein BEN49_03935 [Hymenobacter coccineus]
MAKPATPAALTEALSIWLRLARLEWRFAIGAAVGALAAWLAPASMGTLARSVAAWDGFAAVNLFLILAAMRTADTDDIRRVAASADLPRTLAFLVVIGAALASLVAVVGLLGTLKDVPKAAKALHLALGLGAVALAWTLVHCVFTLRYAHSYYDADEQGHDQGGLTFPDDNDKEKDAPRLEPNYLDFAYFSFVVGMTAQTADIGISRREIRAIALLHGLISFLFNTAIVALTIGTIGGVLS